MNITSKCLSVQYLLVWFRKKSTFTLSDFPYNCIFNILINTANKNTNFNKDKPTNGFIEVNIYNNNCIQ